MTRLTLCLIARDEERMLPGCLASVRGAVDELVVVDTGSQDRTAELARAAGAKVVRFTWCDDFAAARNAALPHATGDWILVLDADERLAPGAGAVLRADLAAPGPAARLLPLHEAVRADADPADVVAGRARLGEPSWLLRVVRRTPDLRWEGAVHEHVDGWLARHGKAARGAEAAIVHLGSDPALRRERRKDERNLALLEKRCAADPADAAGWGFYAMELYQHGRGADAAAAAERGWAAWDRDPRQPAIRTAVVRGLCALATGDTARAGETAAVGRRRLGESSALAYIAGCAAELSAIRSSGPERRRLAAEAAAAYRAALACADRVELDRCIVGATGWLSASRLGEALLLDGRAAEALDAFAAALAGKPGHVEAALGRAEALLELGRPGEAFAAVDPLLGASADGWLLAAAIAHALGATGDARALVARVLDGSAGQISARRGERLQRLAAQLGGAR
jgi:tetratricopeptide (TPR) repeat protein